MQVEDKSALSGNGLRSCTNIITKKEITAVITTATAAAAKNRGTAAITTATMVAVRNKVIAVKTKVDTIQKVKK